MEAILKYFEENRSRYLAELKEFIAIPSVSTSADHVKDIKRCAEWIAGHLKNIGMKGIRIFPTKGHPIVYAEWLGAPGAPTVLLYGHYDVQPVDPVNLWTSPAVRGDHPGREHLRPRDRRRQGPGPHPFQEHRGLHEEGRPPADQPENDHRGRGGDRERAPRALREGEQEAPQGRPRRHLRHVDVRPGGAVALLRPQGPLRTCRSTSPARRATSTRGRSGDRCTTRSRRSPRSSRSSTTGRGG